MICFEDGRSTGLNQRQKKDVTKGMSEVSNKVISEVFSPPRVSEVGEKKRFGRGTAFDLQTGWDLADPQQRKQMWRKLDEERPLLIVLCPPCGPFSQLQEWNFQRMPLEKSMMMLWTGLEHLELAMAIARWQKRQGGYFLFEHPLGARSWKEGCVQKMLQEEGVFQTKCDMCMFGLQVRGLGLNRKPTGLMTNGEEIARQLSRTCDGGHLHVPLLNGKALEAQRYTPQFCEAVVKGLVKQCRADEVFSSGGHIWVASEDLEDALDEEIEGEDERRPAEELPDVPIGERDGERAITESEKKAVHKLHKGMGHPQKGDFIRFLRTARVKAEVVRWAAKSYECDVCKSKAHPKASRMATMPKSYQPNRVVGLDLIYLPEIGGQGVFPALSMLDWGTNYQMVEKIENKQTSTVWNAFYDQWCRVFGVPEVLVTDPGTEFGKGFQETAAGHGVVVHQTAARAPWQQGRTERHGGHYKELMEKARSEVVITNDQEMKSLMREVEQAKNRFSNRSGFSPVQRQIGQWPRVPTSILSDEGIDPSLVEGMVVDDLERLHEMRRVAQKAFVETNARSAVRRTLNARARPWQDYAVGELVYVYRVPRARKRRHGGAEPIEKGSNRPMWVGPGVVVAPDGANLWISMMGELWRASREQCRPATRDEKAGVEEVMKECHELVEEFKRNVNRVGYKDITKEEKPAVEEEPDEDVEIPDDRGNKKRLRSEEGEEPPGNADPMGEELTLEEVLQDGGASDYVPTTPSVAVGSDHSHEVSQEEPEVEVVPTISGTGSLNGQGGPPAVAAPEELDVAQISEQRARTLDGDYKPIKKGGLRRHKDLDPYFVKGGEVYWCFDDPEEAEAEMKEEHEERMRTMMVDQLQKKDYWELDLVDRKLVRHHNRPRQGRYHPAGAKDLPIPLWSLKDERMTEKKDPRTGQIFTTWQDDWKKKKGQEEKKELWCGYTRFAIDEKINLEAWLAAKKGQDEIDLKKESPEDLEGWKVADASEWSKIEASGAVKVLSLEESDRIRDELQKQGKTNRILPSKFIRRNKPAEQPGEPATKKSRLCIRGDMDPDILELERFSPTITTVNFNVVLQIAANQGWEATVGDLKNAFCQSKPLVRENGPLFFKQPAGGVPGLQEGQIVAILAGCYGLVDAPLHWRKSLLEDVKELGYQACKMDPCLWKLYHPINKKLCGVIAIEVDDLFTVGDELHHQQMDRLRKKYTFGKYVYLKKEVQGAGFNGRRVVQNPDGGFEIDMKKFVEERLHPIELEKGRRTMKKEKATEAEVAKMRATCGSLNWLAKEGRPDAAGPSSILSSRLTSLTVEDILNANEVVKALKAESGLSVKIQPLKEMKLSIVTDASFANNGYHSQGGQVLLAHERGLRDGLQVKTNVLAWRSGKLQRVVNSTLAAETQSLSKGLGDLIWTMVLVQELCDG